MQKAQSKTALVLAGGGIMGAAYEIGCLTAVDRLFAPGFSSRRFDIFVGVSAGSVIATLVANHIPPALLFRVIARNELRVFNWRRSDIYRLDSREILASCRDVVRNFYRVFRHYRQNRWKISPHDFFYILQEQFPAGLYSLGPMEEYLCRSFRREGIIDDFHSLPSELYIPAYDLDRGERVVFGTEGFRDVHLCQAITASCAIPYFFRPHKVAGRYYLDGCIGRGSHLDIAIERGARLILVINPRVPVHNAEERFCLPSMSFGKCSSIAELGVSFAWEQAQRIENKEKLDLAVNTYRRTHPEVDILIIEPGNEESVLFFRSPMSMEARNHIMDYGYHLTLGQLRQRYAEFQEVFGRHGIEISDRRLHLGPPAEAA
jgi:predicted acylesterase/phospholipase RssA